MAKIKTYGIKEIQAKQNSNQIGSRTSSSDGCSLDEASSDPGEAVVVSDDSFSPSCLWRLSSQLTVADSLCPRYLPW